MPTRFIALRPDLTDPGIRLRLEQEVGELIDLAEEETLPERVGDPNALPIRHLRRLLLTEADAQWLRGALGALLERRGL
jgi:hypothetical protein